MMKCFVKFLRLFILVFSFSLTSIHVLADSFYKYVGETFYLPIPSDPAASAIVNSWSFSCSNSRIRITNGGSSGPSEAVITSYFNGTATIECFYSYVSYYNGYPHGGTGRVYHTVSCRSNDISISAPKSTLKVGETMQMTYRFSTTTFDSNPHVEWESSSNAVTVTNTGYVIANSSGTAIIFATSNLGGNTATYQVSVQKLDPTSVSITSNSDCVYCDQTLQLYADVLPSGASQDVTWSICDGSSSTATLSSNGLVRGVSPGSITVKATAENGIYSTKTIDVSEPPFSITSTSPTDNGTEVSVFVHPSATYSLDLDEDTEFSSITLKNNKTGKNVAGKTSIYGKTLTFAPTKPLDPQTNYTLSIPAHAVKNKWNTHYSHAVNVKFKTGNLEKLSINSSVTDKFLSKGDKITLKASQSSAKIYYTLNGSKPNAKSTIYTEALIFENDIKLRAIAMGDGYVTSDVLSIDYYLTNVEVAGRYPDANTQLYVYQDVNPSLTFSNKIEPSDNINKVTVLRNGKDEVEGEVIVADSTIYFIPKEPLELGCHYMVSVPQNAIVTWLGESNDATTWTFSTGDYVTMIAAGHEISAAIKTDGSLLTWGDILQSCNSTDGSYQSITRKTPETFVASDVAFVSAGYMHNAIIKTDGTLWMWGRQYCGEFGNDSNVGDATPLKIMNDVAEVSCGGQSSAIVKKDGSLWMVGRNDFGQIGDSTIVVRKAPVKIMDGVISSVAGWCSSYAVKTDGTLMAWGRNDQGQLGNGKTEDCWEPTEIMDEVAIVSASYTEANIVAAVKFDGSLWVWGNGRPMPIKVLDNVSSISIGVGYVTAIKNDGTLWKYANGSTTMIAGRVCDVQSSDNMMIALKEDGSVWSGNPTGLTAMLVEGMDHSELAGLYMNRKTMHIPKGVRSVLVAKPIAINADYSSIEWKSNNEKIVEVTDRGVIIANTLGEADITATITDANGKSYFGICHVTVVESDSHDGMISMPVEQNNMRVWANNKTLYFSGLIPGQQVNVYAIDGALIDSFIAGSTNEKRPIYKQGVYIVRSSNVIVKVLNK